MIPPKAYPCNSSEHNTDCFKRGLGGDNADYPCNSSEHNTDYLCYLVEVLEANADYPCNSSEHNTGCFQQVLCVTGVGHESVRRKL